MSTAIDEIKAQIVSKESELSRVTDELATLRKALAIMSGRRADEGHGRTLVHGQTLVGLIVAIVEEAGHPLSADELVSKARAKGCEASRQTILGAAYRAAKAGDNQKIRLATKGVFATIGSQWESAPTDSGRMMAV